jgi:hypothetical protein
LDGDGTESIVVPSQGGFKFSAGFAGLKSHYSDVRTLIQRLGLERYDREHVDPVKEAIAGVDREWERPKLYPFVLATCISTILAVCGILLPVFGIAGTLWMYLVGAFLFVLAAAFACGATVLQKDLVDFVRDRIWELLSGTTRRPRLDFSVSWAFQGSIPTETRSMIRVYLERGYFDQIVLLAEAPCQVEYSIAPQPQPILVDPLIVGFRGGDDRVFLLGKFDLTPREATTTGEAEFFASGINWDAMV